MFSHKLAVLFSKKNPNITALNYDYILLFKQSSSQGY